MMLEILNPPPAEITHAISDGILRSNHAAAVTREDFAIVRRTEGILAGGVTASVSFSVLYINNIWVAEHRRRLGVGRELIVAAENEGIRLGAKTACVDTLSSQAPTFYEKLGYREFGRLQGEVSERALDRIWFSKPLVGSPCINQDLCTTFKGHFGVVFGQSACGALWRKLEDQERVLPPTPPTALGASQAPPQACTSACACGVGHEQKTIALLGESI